MPEVLTVAEIHHFAYGWFNLVGAFLMAFLGSLLGLVCTARARDARTRGRQARWLVIAAVAIGGSGIWLMHFMAMLGFDVPDSAIRYDPVLTTLSLALAVVPVGVGLFLVVRGPRSAQRMIGGGLLTGLGVLGMHYTGMAALRVAGTLHYDMGLVAASGIVAVVAATVALWFATAVRGWVAIITASIVMGVAVCGMHYTGMAALRVTLSPVPVEVTGMSPFLFVLPITVVTAAALIGMAISALQAMTEEEFDGLSSGRHRGEVPATGASSGTSTGPIPTIAPVFTRPGVPSASAASAGLAAARPVRMARAAAATSGATGPTYHLGGHGDHLPGRDGLPVHTNPEAGTNPDGRADLGAPGDLGGRADFGARGGLDGRHDLTGTGFMPVVPAPTVPPAPISPAAGQGVIYRN